MSNKIQENELLATGNWVEYNGKPVQISCPTSTAVWIVPSKRDYKFPDSIERYDLTGIPITPELLVKAGRVFRLV